MIVSERAGLERRLPVLRAMLEPAAGLWVAWPKLATGLVDNKVCAMDATWSGLRLVIRLRDR